MSKDMRKVAELDDWTTAVTSCIASKIIGVYYSYRGAPRPPITACAGDRGNAAHASRDPATFITRLMRWMNEFGS